MLEGLFPAEVVHDVPRITWTAGSDILVEQHRGLIGYQPEEIVLRTAAGNLTIRGEGLTFRCYTAEEAQIQGSVSCVAMVAKGGGGR